MRMAGRVLAIGDVHGCSRALAAVLDAIRPSADDLVVPLGDYIDRGPDSRGVVEQLLALGRTCRVVPLLGNHEEMLLSARRNRLYRTEWFRDGGALTVESYGGLDRLPEDHLALFESCRPSFETGTHLFVHAGYEPDAPLEQQPAWVLRWRAVDRQPRRPHHSGKVAVVGHSAQRSGEILDLGFLRCIDTYCYGGGWLTALDVVSGEVWQANVEGALRDARVSLPPRCPT